MVEVSDYHCPFCRRHTLTTQPQIDAEYINTGKLRYVFIDYPIDQLHPEAFKAHEAANCAGDQGKYWEMHAKLFEQPPPRDSAQLGPLLVSQAQAVGLDAGQVPQLLREREVCDAGQGQRRAHAGPRRRQHADVSHRADAGARPADEGHAGRARRRAVRAVQSRDRRSARQ